MALTDIRNFVEVDGRVATGGQPTEDQLRNVADAGYDLVINLGLLDPRYCLSDEAGFVKDLGLEYQHIPVVFDSPQLEDFRRFSALMDVAGPRKILVHCALNYRVSAFVALYGQMRFGWTDQQANDHIRRVWDPDQTWTAFIARCRREIVAPLLRHAPKKKEVSGT